VYRGRGPSPRPNQGQRGRLSPPVLIVVVRPLGKAGQFPPRTENAVLGSARILIRAGESAHFDARTLKPEPNSPSCANFAET
jgi:hypothetical protein